MLISSYFVLEKSSVSVIGNANAISGEFGRSDVVSPFVPGPNWNHDRYLK